MPQPEQEQPQPKHQPAEYKFIAAWGRYVGSFPYWVEVEQSRASAENAPLDAIYKSKTGWRTVTNDLSLDGKKRLEDYIR